MNAALKTFSTKLLPGIALFASLSAFAGAGTSLMQTSNVVDPGKFELKVQSDIILNHGGGLNISPHLVTGLAEHLFDVDMFFGTGKGGFQLGALGKYNLLPDVPDQMGLSFNAGLSYLNNDGVTNALVTLGILTSKELDTDFGSITPYGSLQPEFLFGESESNLLMTLVGGAKWKIQKTSPWAFYSELGLSIKDSAFNLAVGASYPF